MVFTWVSWLFSLEKLFIERWFIHQISLTMIHQVTAQSDLKYRNDPGPDLICHHWICLPQYIRYIPFQPLKWMVKPW